MVWRLKKKLKDQQFTRGGNLPFFEAVLEKMKKHGDFYLDLVESKGNIHIQMMAIFYKLASDIG